MTSVAIQVINFKQPRFGVFLESTQVIDLISCGEIKQININICKISMCLQWFLGTLEKNYKVDDDDDNK